MSRMFDEMPEELKMLLAGAIFAGAGKSSPTDLTEEKFDWDNPPVENDLFPTLIPAEAIEKLVQVRKLLIEIKESIPKIPELREKESLNSYARLQAAFFSDEVQDTLVKVNTMLHINMESTAKEIKDSVDEFAHENMQIPTKAVSTLIERLMIHKVVEDLFNK